MARRPHRRRSSRRDRRQAAAAVLAGIVLAAATRTTTHHATAPPAAPAAAGAPAGVPAPAVNVALGRRLAATRGWGGGRQWRCLDALWDRESGWSATAINPRSGAYGIAQALGHGPAGQYPAGPANPPVSDPAAQIRWGLGYIAATYTTPCAAWAHEQSNGWY